MKVNNHYFPRFHIKKWENVNGLIFDKSISEIREIKKLDFSERHFYSDDGTDDLENRIALFETVIGHIIKKVDEADKDVVLSGRELFYLKLYLFLFTYRHNHTTEVIKNDESGIYRSNNYLFEVKRITTHRWRQTFATKFIENDGNMFVLSKLLGHRDISTTQIYTHVSMKKVKEEYNQRVENI